MSFQGKINVYICEKRCGNEIITKDRDEGVTPFLIRCDRCSPTINHPFVAMQSSFYRVDQTLTPTHEWIKPDENELKQFFKKHKIRKGTRAYDSNIQHIERKGLILRKIEK